MAIKKLEHVGVMVNNFEKSIGFYQNILGFELFETFEHDGTNIKLAFLGDKKINQIYVELIFGKENEYPNEGKVNHIAFTVDNIEEEMERLKSHNVVFKSENPTVLQNGGKFIFFQGPDGESLELFQPAT
jgi:lactoylglutathione lyase